MINGQENYQFLNITSEITININNLTIQNCKATDGGAIYNNGTLNITNTNFNNNYVYGDEEDINNGGAISKYVTLYLINTNFNNNKAIG